MRQTTFDDPVGDATALLLELEEMIRGERSMAEVLNLEKEDVRELAEVGDALLETGRLSDARNVYEGCLVLNPVDCSLYERLGLCCTAQGDHDLARTCFIAAQEFPSAEA